MTMLVGIAPDGARQGGPASGRHAGALGGRRAPAVLGRPAVVAARPGEGGRRVPGLLDSTATEVLERARERLAQDITATLLVHHARSAPAGLVEAAERHGARLIVVGSSSGRRLRARVARQRSGRLLHSSPLPVALDAARASLRGRTPGSSG